MKSVTDKMILSTSDEKTHWPIQLRRIMVNWRSNKYTAAEMMAQPGHATD